MRYFGPVHRKVAEGSEHYIKYARTLLGLVEDRIANSTLTQYGIKKTLPDGTTIRVGNINGQRYLEISGKPPPEEREEGPVFVVIAATARDGVLPTAFDVLFLFPRRDRMVKLFQLDEDEHNFQSEPATHDLLNATIFWFDKTITVQTVMQLGPAAQLNQGRFREEEVDDELEWVLKTEDYPIQIQKSPLAPPETPTATGFRRRNNKPYQTAEDDPATTGVDEGRNREIVYSSMLWDQLPGDPQEWFISMRDKDEEQWFFHRFLGDDGDAFDWPNPSSNDPPSLSSREMHLYTSVDLGGNQTKHQIRRLEMRVRDGDGELIPEPRPLTLEKEWTGYTTSHDSNPSGTSENFEDFLKDEDAQVVGYCTFHQNNRQSGATPAKLSFYTAPAEDILDDGGGVAVQGGIANATLAFEFDASVDYGAAIWPDSIGIDDHGTWYRLKGGFAQNPDTDEWEDRSTYILVIQSIRALGQYPEWIFRWEPDNGLQLVYITNYDGLIAEGIKTPDFAGKWLVFRWEENSTIVGDPLKREYYYLKVTSDWDTDLLLNPTMKRILDTKVKPLTGEAEINPITRYGGSLNEMDYDRVYGQFEKDNA